MASNIVNQIICSGGLFLAKDTRRFLFLLRSQGKTAGTWGLVGGKKEPKDLTAIDALKREIQEELGGEIKDAKIIPIEQFTSENGKFIYHTFLIKVEEEFVPELNNEHKGYCWVKLDDHPNPLHPGVWRTFKVKASRDKITALEQQN